MPPGVFMEKRQRRTFTDEFKARAVDLVKTSGKSVYAVAIDLGVGISSLRSWVLQARVDAGEGPAGALTSDERAELSQLRKEVRVLKEEREILKKAAVRSTGHCNTMPPGSWQRGAVMHEDKETRAISCGARRALAALEGRRIGERHCSGTGAHARHGARDAVGGWRYSAESKAA
jgi:transposase